MLEAHLNLILANSEGQRKLAFYLNRKELLDGDLILYQRDLKIAVPNVKSHRTPSWYMKLKIGSDRRVIHRSTKLTSYEEAYRFARAEYDRLTNAAALGHPLDEFTFERHWDDWYERNVRVQTWADQRQRWHLNYANRYFKAYFRNADGSPMPLNQITPQFAHGYWDWRIAYWSTAAAASLQNYNPKRRSAKSKSTHNVKKAPSPKTLSMEQSALNQIFWDAREQARLQHIFKFKSPKSNQPQHRRPHFEKGADYNALTRYLVSYRDCKGHFKNDKPNAWHQLQRDQLYHFIIFMLNSGLRIGEARQMRWCDILLDQTDSDTGQKVAVVGVRKATKSQQNRDVQTQPNGNKTLKEWRKKSPHSGPDDLVWFGQKKDAEGKPVAFTNLNKSFQNFLARVPVRNRQQGLLFNREGEKRSLYSLRHTYATFRREHGVNWEDLALNMGCKRTQLERHYDHSTSNSKRSEIVKSKFASKAKVTQADNGLDTFVVQAMQRFKDGLMDEDTMMGILRGTKTLGADPSV